MYNDTPNGKTSDSSSIPLSPQTKQRQLNDNPLTMSDHAESLCRFGLSERSLAELEQLPVRIQNWSQRVQSLQDYPPFQRIYAKHGSPCLSNVQWLASFQQRPIHQPSGFSLFAHTLHASSGVNKVYKKAKRRAQKLEKTFAELDHYLDNDKLPDERSLLASLQLLTGHTRTLPFSARKRKARRVINEALFEGQRIGSDEVKAYLQELQQTLTDRISFAERSSLRRTLGPEFRGCQTSWSELRQYIRFSQAIRFASVNQAQAIELIENWSERADDFFLATRKAASIHSSLDRLIKLSGNYLDLQSYDDPSIDNILQQSSLAESQIRQHLEFLSLEVDDNTLTPKTIVEMQIA